MIKPTTSMWVPVSSFAIAVLLAFVVGPKSSLYARPPGGATALSCFCELVNLDVTTSVDFETINAKAMYDFAGGIPGKDTNTWLDHYGHVVLTVTTKLPSGAPGPNSTLELDMKATKAKNNIPAFDVIFQPGSTFDLSVDHKTLTARLRGAMGNLGSKITGEAPESRTPLVMHVNVHGETKEKGGKGVCKDDITLTFPTEIDLLGNGAGHGFQP